MNRSVVLFTTLNDIQEEFARGIESFYIRNCLNASAKPQRAISCFAFYLRLLENKASKRKIAISTMQAIPSAFVRKPIQEWTISIINTN